MVIGMTFATLEGKLVQTGGMVVKNVAGLDMAKLMIGSFGTWRAIATVNFKLYPHAAAYAHVRLRFEPDVQDAIAARNAILRQRLQPAALDLRKTSGRLSACSCRPAAATPCWSAIPGTCRLDALEGSAGAKTLARHPRDHARFSGDAHPTAQSCAIPAGSGM